MLCVFVPATCARLVLFSVLVVAAVVFFVVCIACSQQYISMSENRYGWGALAGFMGLVHNGFYDQLPPPSPT